MVISFRHKDLKCEKRYEAIHALLRNIGTTNMGSSILPKLQNAISYTYAGTTGPQLQNNVLIKRHRSK